MSRPSANQCHASPANLAGKPPIRTFSTGATRSTDAVKPDYEGYLSPLVLKRFGEYMTKHRVQPDGSTRASDNWQKGIPLASYMQSAWRHFVAWWLAYRGHPTEDIEESLCAMLFNVQGYLHEYLKMKQSVQPTPGSQPAK